MKTIDQLYEELRAAIDGGSESYTHEDALEQIRYWRGAVAAEREACAKACESLLDEGEDSYVVNRCLVVIRARGAA